MQTAVVVPPGGAVQTPVQNVVILPQYMAPPQSAILPNYSSRSSLILGSTQIAIGILCIIFNAVAIGTDAPEAIIGHGIWGGIFFILTGSFGIMASKQRTTCPIITFMVLSILSVVIFAASMLFISSIGLVVANSHVMQAVPTTENMGGAQVLYTAAYPQGANVLQQQGMQQQQFTIAPMTQVAQPTVAYPPQYTANAAPPAYVQTAPYGGAPVPYGGACGGEPTAPAGEQKKVPL